MSRDNRTRNAPASAGSHSTRDRRATHLPECELPLVLSFSDMNKATDHGQVTVLGSTAGYVVKYRDAWWIADDRGWVRVIVADIAAVLDAEHDRMTAQDAMIARTAAIRAALTHQDVLPGNEASPTNGTPDLPGSDTIAG
jgi:regulator of RNase E activity RraA